MLSVPDWFEFTIKCSQVNNPLVVSLSIRAFCSLMLETEPLLRSNLHTLVLRQTKHVHAVAKTVLSLV